jgi:hypothetical protein
VGEVPGSACFFRGEEPVFSQVEQVRPRGLVDNPMAETMGLDRVSVVRMPQSVANQSPLSVIEYGYPTELELEFLLLVRLSFYENIQLVNRLPDDLEMIEQKISQVTVISLCVKKRTTVLGWSLQYDLRNGDELKHPETMVKH